MLYAGDFVLRYYVRFLQIRSHINLDDAPLAHRDLDGVLITSNKKGSRSPSGLVHFCLTVNCL